MESSPRQQFGPVELPSTIPLYIPDQPVATLQQESQQGIRGNKPSIDKPGDFETEAQDKVPMELDALRQRQAALERERQYLQRLQDIDSEHARLQTRIRQLEQ
jgi:hypothetical protein